MCDTPLSYVADMASFLIQKVRRAISAIVIVPLFITFATSNISNAAVLWTDTVYDVDADYSVSYYADIDSITLGTVDNDSENIIVLIDTYNLPSSLFFYGGGSGNLEFDTNGDSITDFYAFAPSSVLTTSANAFRSIVRGDLSATGCNSRWGMSSSFLYYTVIIPWRCLGAPASTRVEGWLSDSFGYDILGYGKTLYPALPAAAVTTTTPTTTVPPTTTTTTLPPTTTTMYVPATLPLVAPVDTSRPGMVDDWIEYLIVKNPVSITAVLNSTNCCYGVKSGTRIMTVSAKSKSICIVKGKRLYPLKKGSCIVTVKTGKGKTAKKETIKFSVRKK